MRIKEGRCSGIQIARSGDITRVLNVQTILKVLLARGVVMNSLSNKFLTKTSQKLIFINRIIRF